MDYKDVGMASGKLHQKNASGVAFFSDRMRIQYCKPLRAFDLPTTTSTSLAQQDFQAYLEETSKLVTDK